MERRIRLRHSDDVQRVFDEGRSWAHPLLVLVIRPNDVGYSRVGVTASRHVGSAVARNRAKRLLREAARHLYPVFESEGWDIMLIARPQLVHTREREVEEALASLLKRGGCPELHPSVWKRELA
jgi:ribonuclease P protein component